MKQIVYCLLLGLINTIGHAQINAISKKSIEEQYYAASKWRCIGPFRGGRSVSACGVIGDPTTYYMGTTGGGLWKSTDMGTSWQNTSDGYFQTGSVGAVAVAPSDANVIYVGMGEHAVRGVMTSGGDGVYKSTDAGKTWSHMGLSATQHIARIVVHPTNPDIAYVAAQGALYGPSRERGLFMTTDGGKSWKNILYVDENTGCNELSIDAKNPRILYASMWEYGRRPWQVISGPNSSLHKSTDGGSTWTKLTTGLPEKKGKMSIAVCPSNSEKVFALIESDWYKDQGGLYMSEDAGNTWTHVSHDHRIIQRSWYYIELFIDPQNENMIYVMSAPSLRSSDGGKTWEDISGTHGDYHDLWINPLNPTNMIISDDGGSAVTFNRGKTWTHQDLPTAQFYRINVDNEFPYNIYAGQQDNSSVKIASRNINGGSISNTNWTYSAGGESAFLAFDPDNPEWVMGGSYQGTIDLLNSKSRISTNVMADPAQYLGRDAKDMKYRFNWNAPIVYNSKNKAFYHGSQLVLKTTDMGNTWTEISQDLTRNDKSKQGTPGVPLTNEAVGAENYGTISYILISPHNANVIYTGSDDGLLHVTQNGGNTWTNITPKSLTECLINAIEVSPHDPATVYAATTRYKFNDHAPMLIKSKDYGASWTLINNGLPLNAFTRVIREDDTVKDLLYCGTELGLFISRDGGANWVKFQLNLPITPITDLKVHKDNLIASTSGRSFWILDDLHAIRTGTKAINYAVAPATTILTSSYSAMDKIGENFTGMNQTDGINGPSGVVLYYHMDKVVDSLPVKLTITNIDGSVVRSFTSEPNSDFVSYDGGPKAEPTLSKKVGLNRFVWDLRHHTIPGIKNVYIEGSYRGHMVIPGYYTFTFEHAGQSFVTKSQVKARPDIEATSAEFQTYHITMSTMEGNITEMHRMIDVNNNLRVKLEQLKTHIAKSTEHENLLKRAKALTDKLVAWDEEMIQRRSTAYDDVENFPNKFTSDYLYLINQTESLMPRINTGNIRLMDQMHKQWSDLKSRGVSMQKEVEQLNETLCEVGIGNIY